MKKQPLPGTDYQTRCIEAERKAQAFENAYFKSEERYSSLLNAYLKLQGECLELLGRMNPDRHSRLQGIDPLILAKMGREINVAQCK